MRKRIKISALSVVTILAVCGSVMPAAAESDVDITSATDTLLKYFPQSRPAIEAASGENRDAAVSRLAVSSGAQGTVAVSPVPDLSIAAIERSDDALQRSYAPETGQARVTPVQFVLPENFTPVTNLNSDIGTYVNSESSMAQYTLPNELGLQIITVASQRPDSDSMAFPIMLEDGESAVLEVRDDGFAVAFDGRGQQIGVVSPPWARDATGREIDTEFRIVDGVLTQWVDYSTPGVQYPVFSDPNWQYYVEWDLGPSPEMNATNIRAEFYDCFSCVFAADPLLNGAPQHFPVMGELLPLTLGGVGNFAVKLHELTYSTQGTAHFDDDIFEWGFRAEPGHIDGAGSTIYFSFGQDYYASYPDDPWRAEMGVSAYIINDFPLGNGTYQAAATRTWTYMANQLTRNILEAPPGPEPVPEGS